MPGSQPQKSCFNLIGLGWPGSSFRNSPADAMGSQGRIPLWHLGLGGRPFTSESTALPPPSVHFAKDLNLFSHGFPTLLKTLGPAGISTSAKWPPEGMTKARKCPAASSQGFSLILLPGKAESISLRAPQTPLGYPRFREGAGSTPQLHRRSEELAAFCSQHG